MNELQVFTPNPEACAAHSEDFSDCVYGNGHAAMYRDIAAHFGAGVPYPVQHSDALGTIRLLHAFYRSDESGGWVDVDSDHESARLGRPDDVISDLYRTPQSGDAAE